MSPTVEIVIQKQNFNLKKREPQKSAKRGLYWVRLFKSHNKLLYWLDRVVFPFLFLLDPALLNSHYEKDFTLLSPFYDN